MSNAASFFVPVAVLLSFACGGGTSTPPDAIDGSADASADANGVLDVAGDATGEAAHDAIGEVAQDATADLVVRDADANGILDVAEDAAGEAAQDAIGEAAQDATGEIAPDATADLVVRDVTGVWQSLRLDNGTGPCPPQISCSSSWVVSPDGQMATNRLGDAGVAQMTSPDLAELDSIVSSAPFLDGMTNGFVCNQPPTDVFVSLRLERGGTFQTQGVTGCVISGPSGNLPRRVSELLTKY